MKRYQNIGLTKNPDDDPITVGEYTQITAPVYTDNNNTILDPNLATYSITWRLLGVRDIALITRTTANGGITVNNPTGWVTVIINGPESVGITNGIYKHIAEAVDAEGNNRGLFEGKARVVNG